MTVSKSQFLWTVYNKKPFCVLTGKGFSKNVGFIGNVNKLKAEIATFATEHDCKRVRVYYGRNIMNVDEGPIGFSVKVEINVT